MHESPDPLSDPSSDQSFGHSDQGLPESVEVLQEIQAASQGDPELHEFVTLVLQLIKLNQDLGSDGPDLEIIERSMQAIHAHIDGENDQLATFASLHEQAHEQWGFALNEHADQQTDEPTEEGDVAAPSAEEVSELLSQFASSPLASATEDDDPHKSPFESNVNSNVENHSRDDHGLTDGTDADQAADETRPLDHLDDELREAYLDDANTCLGAIEQALLLLADHPQSPEPVDAVLRELHTLKGASGSVGMTVVADQIHSLEEKLRDRSRLNSADDVDTVLQEIDSIRCQITGVQRQAIDGQQRYDSAQTNTRQPTLGHEPSPAPPPKRGEASNQFSKPAASGTVETRDEYVRVRESQLARLMDMLAELVMLRNRRETEVQNLQSIYQELVGSVSRMRQLGNAQASISGENGSLRISEVASDVREVAQSVRQCVQPLAEGNSAVSQFIRQFRRELIELRRTPVSGLIGRLQRSVREAAGGDGKQVDLRLAGDDATIERSMQQRLYEPLLHIVRNSVCHGIESPEVRIERGKSARGTISIQATSGADLLTITVEDDGAGLDYEAIRRRGLERGLISEHHAVPERELAQLIFRPGFSTRSSADQLAGRGVGMDVVASTLQRLRGWLEIDSQPGSGTTIRLCCPVPSLVQHAMVFRCGTQLFALPMQSIQHAGSNTQELREIDFSRINRASADLANPNTGDASGKPRITLAGTDANERIAIIVDEIVGPEEVVVRPLPTLLRNHPYCSGASLSGLGKTVLLLDSRRLTQSYRGRLQPASRSTEAASSVPPQRPRVLVADDSLSARKRAVRSLQRYDVEITEVHDGREALQRLKREHFDAVFSDLDMPHVTGLELLKELRDNWQDTAPPVVLITSRDEEPFVSEARDLGVAQYLNKPVEDDEIDQAIASIASLSHLTTASTCDANSVHGDLR